MKRGFLLRAEAKKAAAKRRDVQNQTESSIPRPGPKGSDVDEGKPAGDNQTEEGKALPSAYDINSGELLYNLRDSDPRITGFSKDMIVIAMIPQSVPHGETQSAWIVNASTKRKVLNAAGYPARIPKPRPDLYEVRSTSDMGEGLFAKRDIRRGEIILAERPLLVTPDSLSPLSQGSSLLDLYGALQKGLKYPGLESFLEAAVARLPPESQADFRALQNVYAADKCGPLLGITRTNNYDLRNLFDGSDSSANYKFVNKIASRINHSCVSNVKYYFKVNSFSVQFFALRDIKAGDQLFYPYCLADRSLAQRQADLASYDFICKCPCCVNATPETDELRTTFKIQIASFKETLIDRPKIDKTVLERALRFEKDVLKEGLDADDEYLVLLMAISAGYSKLGKGEESRKYSTLMEKFQKFILDEWRGISIPET